MTAATRDGWVLGVDFGTCYTAAAVRNRERADVLEVDGRRRFSSAVMAAADGSLLIGEEAERRSRATPGRMERAPKRYIEAGQVGIPLGDQLVPLPAVIARILGAVWEEALRQHGGVPPAETRLTHPASWGKRRMQVLIEGAQAAGITEVVLLPEPEAAATYLAEQRITGAPIEQDGVVAVYDLGGGTCDIAVLRRTGSRFVLLGEPSGDDRIGGDLFDEHLYRHLGEHALPSEAWQNLQESDEREWRHANHEFRRSVTAAKEAISALPTSSLYIPLPVDREVQISREEFAELIRRDVDSTLDMLDDSLRSAGESPDHLAGLFLVGGSSRIPLIAALIRQRFGRTDFKGDPKTVVALGAAQATLLHDRATGPSHREREPRGEDASSTDESPPRPPRMRGLSDPRQQDFVDLLAELVDDARRGVPRVLVLRDAALLESIGMGAGQLLEETARVADGFTVLRSAGSRSLNEPPWAGLANLLRPLESREPLRLEYAALPWTGRPGALKRVVRPIDSRRQMRARKGKADNNRSAHASAVVRLLYAAAQEKAPSYACSTMSRRSTRRAGTRCAKSRIFCSSARHSTRSASRRSCSSSREDGLAIPSRASHPGRASVRT